MGEYAIIPERTDIRNDHQLVGSRIPREKSICLQVGVEYSVFTINGYINDTMSSKYDMYNTAFLGILQNEGNIETFLDAVFSFLYRR